MLFAALALLVLSSVPRWRHSRRWGYWPSGGLAFILAGDMIVFALRRM